MTDASSPTCGLSEAEYARTERNRVLIGDEAQRRLHASKVLMIGAGGLGSPCLLALTAAGIGAIDICETDTVDVSNLQRQTLYRVHDIGRPRLSWLLNVYPAWRQSARCARWVVFPPIVQRTCVPASIS